MTLENDDYIARLQYIDLDYNGDLANNQIDPEGVLVTTTPKRPSLPEIKFIFKTKNTDEHIGVSLNMREFIYENEIETFSEELRKAKTTITELKTHIQKYFPGVLAKSQLSTTTRLKSQ